MLHTAAGYVSGSASTGAVIHVAFPPIVCKGWGEHSSGPKAVQIAVLKVKYNFPNFHSTDWIHLSFWY